MPDAGLLTELLALAASFSGYAPIGIDDLPPVVTMPGAMLQATACPEQPRQCERLVAMFDRGQYRILIRDSLDLRDVSDNSFLLHELVHVLEYKAKGERFQVDCDDSLESERTAYRAQNAYLRSRGRTERHGDMFSDMRCSVDQPAAAQDMRLQPRRRRLSDSEAFDAFMRERAAGVRERVR